MRGHPERRLPLQALPLPGPASQIKVHPHPHRNARLTARLESAPQSSDAKSSPVTSPPNTPSFPRRPGASGCELSLQRLPTERTLVPAAASPSRVSGEQGNGGALTQSSGLVPLTCYFHRCSIHGGAIECHEFGKALRMVTSNTRAANATYCCFKGLYFMTHFFPPHLHEVSILHFIGEESTPSAPSTRDPRLQGPRELDCHVI